MRKRDDGGVVGPWNRHEPSFERVGASPCVRPGGGIGALP